MEAPVIRYVTIGSDREAWQARPNQYCPKCGATGPFIWLLESSGTYNNNDIGLCLNCDTAWEWTYFSDDWIRARVLRLREIDHNPEMVNA